MTAESAQAAITRFVATVNGHIRVARLARRDRDVIAVAFAATDRLDAELPDCVAAVIVICRLVGREVRALVDDAVAAAYLEATE